MKKTKRAARKTVPIPIRAVDFVMYCSRDAKELRAWYAKLFGLKRGEEWNAYWSEFATKPISLCINGPNRTNKPQWDWSGPPAVALAVEDIHAAAAACKRRKIKIAKGPVETSVCWMLFILDPEGNRLVLHQRKNGTAG
jgi:predicted enzyme related to lactoylglutathione lyase